MISSTKVISALSFLLVATTVYASAQNQVCYVRYSYTDIQRQAFSSFFGLGEFRMTPADETVTKSFYHDESKVAVNVGVEYPSRTAGNKDAGLRLAIAFTGKPEDVFHEVGGAETIVIGRNPLNNSIMVSQSIKDETRIWTFYLSCVPEKSLPKWRRRAQQVIRPERE
jgi:hypothetical protein